MTTLLASPAAPAQAHGSTRLRRVAHCESGHRWHINTGNGYYGGLQFSLSSWRWVGGSGYPHHASKYEQLKRGRILRDWIGGANAWPTCWPRSAR
ncbi:MAG: transglycosylase family protein [Euzebyales bacterium]|nr:transglycosylase family protein [Euzebyales bacterium]